MTGLTVSAASLVLVVVTVVTLAATLAETYSLLALASNVVVTAGLLPSLWLIHRQQIWRWVAYGVAVGLALTWLALPFVIF
jgi:ABC-type spermidine/putrescine transport system permease subunit I